VGWLVIVKIGEVAMATLLNWPQAHWKRKTGEILTKREREAP